MTMCFVSRGRVYSLACFPLRWVGWEPVLKLGGPKARRECFAIGRLYHTLESPPPPEKWFFFFFWKRQLCSCWLFFNFWGVLLVCDCAGVCKREGDRMERECSAAILSGSRSHSLVFQSPNVGLHRADQAAPTSSSLCHQTTSLYPLPFCKKLLKFLIHNLFIVVIFTKVFPCGHCCPIVFLNLSSLYF